MTQLAYSRVTNTVSSTKQLASTLAAYVSPGDVIMLTGNLGAGKTHFVKGLAEGLGINIDITSPTFSIYTPYQSGRIPLLHFDLYRLDSPEQLEDIDFYGAVEDFGVSCIEWGEKCPNEMPQNYLEIVIDVIDAESREITAIARGRESRNLLQVWAKDTKSHLARV